MSRGLSLFGSALAALAAVRGMSQSESFLGDILNMRDSTTAVYAATNSDYTRERLPDGSLKPETYVLEDGGCIESAIRDPSLDGIGVRNIAHALAGPMRRHGYVPAAQPLDAKLIVVVYWGVTSGGAPGLMNFEGPAFSPFGTQIQMAQNNPAFNWRASKGFAGDLTESTPFDDTQLADETAEMHNAVLLGYALDLSETPSSGLIHNIRRDDLLADLSESRYFVVLLAYDLQALTRQKVRRMLWEARFSLRERGNDFGEMLPLMTAYASRYFGGDTRGLIRDVLPEGRVEIGEPKVVAGAPSREPVIPEVAQVPGALSLAGRQPQPTPRPIPAEIAQRIEAYNKDSADLRNQLEARISRLPAGDDVRRAIDAFNAEHAGSIATLGREAQRIRVDLARSSSAPAGSGQDPLDSLVRQFAEGAGRVEVGDSAAPQ